MIERDALEARFVLEHVAMPALRFERGLTARVVAAISPDVAGYRPACGARSAAELARHLVCAELRFLEGAATGVFPDRIDECEGIATSGALAAVYQRRAAEIADSLMVVTGEQLSRMLNYRDLIRLPALGFVQFALNHTIHHRGQLSVYLRAAGVGVPPIYG